MLEEELELDEAIAKFIKRAGTSADEVKEFLLQWAGHPDYYVNFTTQVATNLAVLNVALLNELREHKRFHLVKALVITLEVAISIKWWEYMLGRENGTWYWDKHGLFVSSLHGLIRHLNALQKHVSEIEHAYGFTGRLVCLEGKSEQVFLE
jgi:hypothetical protein